MLSTTEKGRASDTPRAQKPVPHHSLALGFLIRRLGGERKVQILDLGPAVGANVAFFGRYPCQLYIADLFRSLLSFQSPGQFDPDTLNEALEAQLPHGGTFDLILLWDLLDYLVPQQIRTLGCHLSRLSQPDTLLFAMVSTRKLIADRPRSYEIGDEETLIYDDAWQLSRACPRYNAPDLERALPQYGVETSYLLRNGIQEYLLNPRVPPTENDGSNEA